MIDAEARAGKRIHPIAFEQAADDEPKMEVYEIAGVYWRRMEAQGHGGSVPVDDDADEREERDAAQLGEGPAASARRCSGCMASPRDCLAARCWASGRHPQHGMEEISALQRSGCR